MGGGREEESREEEGEGKKERGKGEREKGGGERERGDKERRKGGGERRGKKERGGKRGKEGGRGGEERGRKRKIGEKGARRAKEEKVGVPQQKALGDSHPDAGLEPGEPKAHVCPTARKLRVIRPPIHPRVRPAENGGEFFVLCFQPVTFPRALCAQVAQASARATMATAHSGSARDRHRIGRALGPPAAVQTHSPHSGDRRARPRPGKGAAGLHRR